MSFSAYPIHASGVRIDGMRMPGTSTDAELVRDVTGISLYDRLWPDEVVVAARVLDVWLRRVKRITWGDEDGDDLMPDAFGLTLERAERVARWFAVVAWLGHGVEGGS